ncbi:glycosyltransferase family 8 protein [Streptococcus anginosus]|nr:glycosyltransferase family 8 protein [Streptococcus anginosus]MED5907846.1 glycosyltransferase family 8 protein [Streptococcus anginosus]MED5920912.1 glycosyltransferase family 8 protein [Streptococcus anginosus]MED5937605.1 glycosyltransferase family 8 protein [Streptococcus anginosus]
MTEINLLFSIDDRYVEQFKTTLYSVYLNLPSALLHVFVLQKKLLKRNVEIEEFCEALGIIYEPVVIGEKAFEDAPSTDRYPETIYYRLLAHEYLPKDLDRILYLDADILCLNDICPLYEMELGASLYAAASHGSDANMTDLVNKMRLQNFEAESYYNSGVLLMNLTSIRKEVKREAILDYIAQNSFKLFLPDQDVLNALYGHLTIQIPDELYNYDARYNVLYYARSKGEWDLDWVIENTVFLHFCGRDKPWLKEYHGRYAALYKHYQHRNRKVGR